MTRELRPGDTIRIEGKVCSKRDEGGFYAIFQTGIARPNGDPGEAYIAISDSAVVDWSPDFRPGDRIEHRYGGDPRSPEGAAWMVLAVCDGDLWVRSEQDPQRTTIVSAFSVTRLPSDAPFMRPPLSAPEEGGAS